VWHTPQPAILTTTSPDFGWNGLNSARAMGCPGSVIIHRIAALAIGSSSRSQDFVVMALRAIEFRLL
jgi:hypothetical protein